VIPAALLAFLPRRPRLILASLIFGAAFPAAQAAPLRVGIDLDGEPMTSVDAKGVPQGFAVEIMDGIAREMGFKVVYVARPWAQMLDDFKAGRTDALANITYTTPRTAFIEFSVPHIVMNGAIFVRKGDHAIKTLSDLRNVRIAVKPDGAPYEYLVSHGWAEHIVPSDTLRDSLRAVTEGRADAAIDARIVGLKNTRDEHLANIEVADVALFDFAQRLHIGLHPGDAANLTLVNEGLARLHADGSYDRIYEKWIDPLDPRQLRFPQLEPYLAPAAVVLIAIIGIFYWQRRLLRRVARQAEAVRLSEVRLTLVLEGSEDGFWDWDLRTGRIERSERWASMLGYPLADIEPTFAGSLPLIHPDDLRDRDPTSFTRRVAESGRYHREYRMKTRTGDWRWILDRGKVVARSADGAPWRIAGTHTDITDLKQAQATLARQEAQFRFIYEHAPVGLSWLQHEKGETRVVNLAHERITGVTVDRSRDTANYVAATYPDDRETQRVLQERLYRGEISHFEMEKRYLHANGSVVWAMLTMHLYRDPVTGENREITTLVDINDLKRMAEEKKNLDVKILETQKLESLGILAGGIAHDFNNLLTVIIANTSFLRMADHDAASRHERLAFIESAGQRAADLCRQMLAYAGKGRFVVEHVDLSRLVRETANLLNVSISKKASLVVNLADDLPAVEVDASQVQQVVMNLVINASDALGDSPGEIRLTTQRGRPQPTPGEFIHSFGLTPGDCACLEVADSGCGMDAVTLARIFDPFFTTKFAGRGLGLAAVLGIVRACRGTLTVASTPGRGTTFRLYLPAAAPLAATAVGTIAPAGPRGAEPQRRGTVLVADDEPAVLLTTAHLLQHQGYEVVTAANGHEAVSRFQANPTGFAVILLDLTMPGLNGAEVLREIRALNAHSKVLIMSGFSEQDVLDRLSGLGPVEILHKPFTREMLLGRLAEIIAS
jgi:two-component system cell cycle sensor histidine kinase/response regulator CckA